MRGRARRVQPDAPLMQGAAQVVHAIPGRVRLRLAERAVLGRPEALAAYLRQETGVTDVRLNASCGSVTLRFDPARCTVDALRRRVGGATLPAVRAPRPQAASNGHAHEIGNGRARRRLIVAPTHAANAAEPSGRWRLPARLPLGLAGVAAGLSLAGEVAVAPWLLAGAAVPIFRRAAHSLLVRRRLNVDVLDASATAVLASQAQFPTAAVMVFLVSIGDCLRDLTRQRSTQTIERLYTRPGAAAWVVRGGRKERVPAGEIRVGDEVVVYPGEMIPVDGRVTHGRAAIDQRLLTGESMPVLRVGGEAVFANTVVADGKIYLRADGVGRSTRAAQILQLILDSPEGETRVQNYAERFADRLVPFSLLGAVGAAATGLGADTAASLLIVDFGTGIRMAAPTTVLASMARAARAGVLIKGGAYLERLAAVDAIVFDKTGTLTAGWPAVRRVVAFSRGFDEDEVLGLAAAAERRFTHPVAAAVVRAAQARGLAIGEREASRYVVGHGVWARLNERTVLVGSRRFLRNSGVDTRAAEGVIERARAEAVSALFVAVNGVLEGAILYSDPPRLEAAAVVAALRERGIEEIVMLTGDHPSVSEAVSRELGIARCIAQAFPEQKAEVVEQLQRAGRRVALVGDGINDSPALARADVGIAVHGGADIAHQTAGVILLEESLWKIPEAIDIARQSMRLIRQSWAMNLYPNVAAIGLSLSRLGGPIVSTAISNGAAVLATLNGLRPLLHVNGAARGAGGYT